MPKPELASLISLVRQLPREPILQQGSASLRPPAGEARRGPPEATETWTLAELAGRLAELSGWGASARLTVAFGLVLDAQRRAEPVAWIATRDHDLYPPDAAAGGVDLDALVVVRVPDLLGIAKAADHLTRSGAFGLVVLDLGAGALAQPIMTRLLGLAHTHQTAVLCLTRKPARAPSLGSLISLRGEARWVRGEGGLTVEVQVLKDKRRPPGAVMKEVCRGPAGLR